MKIRKLYLSITSAALLLAGPVCAAEPAAGVKPETTALYQKARDQVSRLTGTASAKQAPEIVDQATAQVELAQTGLKDGDDRKTREASELALVQVRLAQAVTAERQAAAKSEATAKELAALEQKLAAILAGKGEKP